MDKSTPKVLATVVKPLDGSQVSGSIHGVMKENVFLALNTMVVKKSPISIHSVMEHGASKEEEILSVPLSIVRKHTVVNFYIFYILLFIQGKP